MVVQFSSYDDSFVAKRRSWTFVKKIAIAIGLLPALCVLIIPSFQLGRLTLRTPSFPIPNELTTAEAFILPMHDEIASLVLQGQKLTSLPLKSPQYMGAVGIDSQSNLELEILFKPDEPIPGVRRTFRERFFTHPTVNYYKKTIQVKSGHNETPALRLPARVVGNYENEESLHPAQPPEIFNATEAPTSEASGKNSVVKVNAACWQPPVPLSVLTPFGAQLHLPGKTKVPYLHLGIDLRTNVGQAIVASGTGQVIAISDKPLPGRTITISHGGGLYSRYLHLKDSGVHRGEKVSVGQTIGWAGPIRRYEAPRLHWEVFFDKKALDPQSFLALSSKLCDLK
jgi:murein DD-endopeptidase MepM/ murein hydrolase activator NlpD